MTRCTGRCSARTWEIRTARGHSVHRRRGEQQQLQLERRHHAVPANGHPLSTSWAWAAMNRRLAVVGVKLQRRVLRCGVGRFGAGASPDSPVHLRRSALHVPRGVHHVPRQHLRHAHRATSCSGSGPVLRADLAYVCAVTSISPTIPARVSSRGITCCPAALQRAASRSSWRRCRCELYLARNEIFARHGRGFKNQDLTDYFATKRWYTQTYTPEEFDAISSSQLNDYELKNVQTMYEIEQSRNSRIWRRRSRLTRNRSSEQGPRFAPRGPCCCLVCFSGRAGPFTSSPRRDAIAHAQLVADALAGGFVLVADGRLHGGHHDVGHVLAHFAGEVEHA